MLRNVGAGKITVEFVSCRFIVVSLQHRCEHRFTEAAGTDDERKVDLINRFNETRLVRIGVVVAEQIAEIRQAERILFE